MLPSTSMPGSASASTSASAPSSTGNSASNPYLTQPSSSSSSSSHTQSSHRTPTSTSDSKQGTRLYIGNLHPTVDEYALIQTFTKYGKIVKLDFLFHKSGPQRGQPRGYAFLEYSTNEEALQAVASANNKTLRGKRISVTFATQNVNQDIQDGGIGPQRRNARGDRDTDTSKHTNLSMIKNASRPTGGTDAKIAAMEAKLAKLRSSSNTKQATQSSSSSSNSHGTREAQNHTNTDGSKAKTGISSLPPKPTSAAARSSRQSRH